MALIKITNVIQANIIEIENLSICPVSGGKTDSRSIIVSTMSGYKDPDTGEVAYLEPNRDPYKVSLTITGEDYDSIVNGLTIPCEDIQERVLQYILSKSETYGVEGTIE